MYQKKFEMLGPTDFSVKDLITDLEIKYQRKPGSVKLLAVSKGQSVDKILKIYEKGQRAFGENYCQEALEKIKILPKDIEWHFIGSLQSNKTKSIAQHFNWVQSVDNLKIAQRLHNQRPANLPPLNICIQVNIAREKTKSGVSLEEVKELAKSIRQFNRLQCRGLMAIPAPSGDVETQKKVFERLKKSFDTLNHEGCDFDTLSMGMSEDFESAIAAGSTLVRLGRLIFGERPTKVKGENK